ncbi:NAD(P)H-dependent glycerol-3-phosphate dehydrogenase [Aquipuribacter nitratireducens]|uniref:Glycerol-3-phosphate dehydrogenase [NAD(P)+] n=1 Tax=Aquipuribacter nitratireducens TaxID=650104 RepID=A0ABW0GQ92_9MICO
MSARPRVCVLGSGSWGTTFAAVTTDAGCPTTVWGRDPEIVRSIASDHANPRYLPGVELPEALTATTDAVGAVSGADVVVVALPSKVLRRTVAPLAAHVRPDAVLVSLSKGVEHGSDRRMSEVVAEAAGVGRDRVAVVSGPNLAREIAARQPTATVVAATTPEVAEQVAAACSTDYFRPYTNTDVVGVEIAGAMKNVIALAVGMAVGLGMGDNSRASIITRGLAETARLGAALGADPQTFAGLAGMGDLVATCTSPLSRNRTFGEELGRGSTVEEVVARTRQTAEGVVSCGSLLHLARSLGVDVPITEAVTAVVSGGLRPEDLARLLLSRARKPEVE